MSASIEANTTHFAHTNEMVATLFGLRATFDLDERDVVRALAKADELSAGFQVSAGENRDDLDGCLSRWGTDAHRAKGADRESATRLAFWSSFTKNAAMATAHFGPILGCMQPGARADLVVLD